MFQLAVAARVAKDGGAAEVPALPLIAASAASGLITRNVCETPETHCFLKKKPAIDLCFVNDGQLTLFWPYIEL